jgi:hypothetical protein
MSDKRPEKLEMIFSNGGTLTARLLWDKAPRTCEAMVAALQKPVTSGEDCGILLHAQYAGSEVYFEDFPAVDDIPFENTTARMDENMYLTNKIDGGVLAYYVNPAVKSFCIVYGELIPRRTVDVPIALNIFAEIEDKEEAKRIGWEARTKGPGKVTIQIKQ